MNWVESKVNYCVWISVPMSDDDEYIGQASSLAKAKKLAREYVIQKHREPSEFAPSVAGLESAYSVFGDAMFYMVDWKAPSMSEQDIESRLRQITIVANKKIKFK